MNFRLDGILAVLALVVPFLNAMLIKSSLNHCIDNTMQCCNGLITIYVENQVLNSTCSSGVIVRPTSTPQLVTSCFSCIIPSIEPRKAPLNTSSAWIFLIILPLTLIISTMLFIVMGYSKLRLKERRDRRSNNYIFDRRGVLEERGASLYRYSWYGLILLLWCNKKGVSCCSMPEFTNPQLSVFTLTPSVKICELHGVHYLTNYEFVYPLVELYETSAWDKYSWITKDCGNSYMCSNSDGCSAFGPLGKLQNSSSVHNSYKKFCVIRANDFQGFNCYFRSWWCWVYTLEPLFNKYPRFKIYRLSSPIVDYKLVNSGKVEMSPSIVPLQQNPLGSGIIAKSMVNGNLWYCGEFSYSGRPLKDQIGDLQIINSTLQFVWDSIKVDDASWDSTGESEWPQSFIKSHLENACELLTSDYTLRPSPLGGQLKFNGSPILGRLMMLGDNKKLVMNNITNTCYDVTTELHGAKRESSHFTVLIKANSYNSSSTMVISSPCFVGVHSINCDGKYNYFLASDVSSECSYNGSIIDRSTDYRPFIDEETGHWMHHDDWTYYGLNGLLGGSILGYAVLLIIVLLLLRNR